MKEKIFAIIERAQSGDKLSMAYDIFMMVAIFASIVPLMCMDFHGWFMVLNSVCCTIFVIDYALRLYTADLKLKKGRISYLLYPFTLMALIDLLTILPYFSALSNAFRVLRITRLIKIARVFRFFRYSRKMMAFIRVLKKERQILLSVLMIAMMYIFTTALVMFNVEPHVNPYTHEQTFSSFFDALYWATVTLTTVGYGDLCPVTDIGRFIGMLSSLFGVAIIALPSGVITASYLDELRKGKKGRDGVTCDEQN